VKHNVNQQAAEAIIEHDTLTSGSQFVPLGWYWYSFKSRFAGPRIQSMPRLIRGPLFWIRNLRFYRLPRKIPFTYSADGMATLAIPSFLSQEDFQRSYFRLRMASREVVDPGLHWRAHQAIWCASHCMEVDGDFVECGTGRGLMMTAVLQSLPNWSEADKRMLLFDTFSPYGIDPLTGKNNKEQGVRGTYASSIDDVKQNFSEWEKVELIEGSLPESLTQVRINKISFLHIDLNHAPVEVAVIHKLWPLIQKGGIMLLDDYAQVKDQNDAMNQLSKILQFQILTTASGQGIVIKS